MAKPKKLICDIDTGSGPCKGELKDLGNNRYSCPECGIEPQVRKINCARKQPIFNNNEIIVGINIAQKLAETIVCDGITGLKLYYCNAKNCKFPPGTEFIDCNTHQEDISDNPEYTLEETKAITLKSLIEEKGKDNILAIIGEDYCKEYFDL